MRYCCSYCRNPRFPGTEDLCFLLDLPVTSAPSLPPPAPHILSTSPCNFEVLVLFYTPTLHLSPPSTSPALCLDFLPSSLSPYQTSVMSACYCPDHGVALVNGECSSCNKPFSNTTRFPSRAHQFGSRPPQSNPFLNQSSRVISQPNQFVYGQPQSSSSFHLSSRVVPQPNLFGYGQLQSTLPSIQPFQRYESHPPLGMAAPREQHISPNDPVAHRPKDSTKRRRRHSSENSGSDGSRHYARSRKRKTKADLESLDRKIEAAEEKLHCTKVLQTEATVELEGLKEEYFELEARAAEEKLKALGEEQTSKGKKSGDNWTTAPFPGTNYPALRPAAFAYQTASFQDSISPLSKMQHEQSSRLQAQLPRSKWSLDASHELRRISQIPHLSSNSPQNGLQAGNRGSLKPPTFLFTNFVDIRQRMRRNLTVEFAGEWKYSVTSDRRFYFINKKLKVTTWIDPRSSDFRLPPPYVGKLVAAPSPESWSGSGLAPLPPLWNYGANEIGRLFFWRDDQRKTTWVDPRIRSIPTDPPRFQDGK